MVQQGWLLQRASEMCLLQVLSHFCDYLIDPMLQCTSGKSFHSFCDYVHAPFLAVYTHGMEHMYLSVCATKKWVLHMID